MEGAEDLDQGSFRVPGGKFSSFTRGQQVPKLNSSFAATVALRFGLPTTRKGDLMFNPFKVSADAPFGAKCPPNALCLHSWAGRSVNRDGQIFVGPSWVRERVFPGVTNACYLNQRIVTNRRKISLGSKGYGIINDEGGKWTYR